jgi:hypothetical protein
VPDVGGAGPLRRGAGDLLGRLDRIVLTGEEDRLGGIGLEPIELAEATERGRDDAPAAPTDPLPRHEPHVVPPGELVAEPAHGPGARIAVEMEEEGGTGNV